MRRSLIFTAAPALATNSFIAYNDAVPSTSAAMNPGNSTCYWTRYTHGRNAREDAPLASESPRKLFDIEGRPLDVTVEYVEKVTSNVTIYNHKVKMKVKRGSPAWEEFGQCMCVEAEDCDEETDECECSALNGNLSYNEASGWEFRYIIAGLNPECTVALSFFVERGPKYRADENYMERYSMFTLERATSFTPETSMALAAINAGQTLAIRSGSNFAGHIAKWTGVQHSGTIEVVATHGSQALLEEANVEPPPHAFKGYAGGVFKVQQLCPTASPTTAPVIEETNAARTEVEPKLRILVFIIIGVMAAAVEPYM